MKKLFALFLACIMLFLTSCNQTPPSETTKNSQNQGNPTDTLPQGIVKNGVLDVIDIPSRIIFEQKVGTAVTDPSYVFYYSKADGKAYVYCFDPLCDHAGGKCLANPEEFYHIPNFELSNTFFINGRFYTASQYGQIYSFSFDGSDLKIEYGKDSFTVDERNQYSLSWSPNFRAYDKYIYIRMNADESGNPRTLRFNTETKEMEDLTKKTGNRILPQFFYNGELYGRDAKLRTWVKADLELKEITHLEEQPSCNQFYGSVFFDFAYEQIDSKTDKYLGIQSYDMKTGEKEIITNEMLGLEANQYVIVAVDENYVYFYQYKQIFVGTYINTKGQETKCYKYNDGNLYRVKHDGTACTLIYDNPNFEFNSREAVLCGDQIIIEGREYSIGADGYIVRPSNSMQVGTIGEDGKIEKFEPIELVY